MCTIVDEFGRGIGEDGGACNLGWTFDGQGNKVVSYFDSQGLRVDIVYRPNGEADYYRSDGAHSTYGSHEGATQEMAVDHHRKYNLVNNGSEGSPESDIYFRPVEVVYTSTVGGSSHTGNMRYVGNGEWLDDKALRYQEIAFGAEGVQLYDASRDLTVLIKVGGGVNQIQFQSDQGTDVYNIERSLFAFDSNANYIRVTDMVARTANDVLGYSAYFRQVEGTDEANDSLTGLVYADRLLGLGGDDNLWGAANNDILYGGAGSDTLDGGEGSDTMYGDSGADVYLVDNLDDRVFEATGGGRDEVLTQVSYVLAADQEIETLATADDGSTSAIELTGNGFDQMLRGNAGENVLTGLGGNDVYVVNNAGDRVFEAAGGGSDRVRTSVSYTLSTGQEIEWLETTSRAGTTAMNLIGNELANTLVGNAGANTLNGGVGVDVMQGLSGNDIYYVDNVGDKVFEGAGLGTSDRVAASVSYVLATGQHIEILATASPTGTSAINLTGNELVQTLIGNAGANSLNGRGGADSLYGYGGNDIYYVDAAGDKVFEGAGLGTNDRVAASVSYVLAPGQQIEALQTTATAGTGAINLWGNNLGQTILGNAGANLITSLQGVDTLRGNGGTDIFIFNVQLGNANADSILDFSHAADTIRLSKSVFAALNLGGLGADAFKDLGVGGAPDSTDRILYDSNTGVLSYDADGSGSGANAQVFATLTNTPANLDHTDFMIVA